MKNYTYISIQLPKKDFLKANNSTAKALKDFGVELTAARAEAILELASNPGKYAARVLDKKRRAVK